MTRRGKALQKRYLPVTIVVVVLAVLGIGGYAVPLLMPQAAPVSPQRILLPNAGGAVVFDHNAHAALPDMRCSTCHHDSLTPQPDPAAVRSCAQCHGQTFDAAFRKEHVTRYDPEACVTCHHYELARKKWGHKRHARELGLDCRDCHHKDTGIEPEPQNCADCHEAGAAPTRKPAEAGTPPNLGDAVHARCVTCHEDLFAKKVNGCASCHDVKPMREQPAEARSKVSPLYADCVVCHEAGGDKLLLGRMDAFHKQCMGCHESAGKGPFKKGQCAQCHTSK